MEEKKKKFVKPDAQVIDFANDDIITVSKGDTFGKGWTGEEWEEE